MKKYKRVLELYAKICNFWRGPLVIQLHHHQVNSYICLPMKKYIKMNWNHGQKLVILGDKTTSGKTIAKNGQPFGKQVVHKFTR
jgi:hypothetical protein